MKSFRINTQFQDYDSFVDQVCSWDLNFIQLNSGKFHAELFQYGDPEFLLSSLSIDRTMHQKGTAPGLWTFGIPMSGSSEIIWKNILTESNSIIVYSPGSELEAISKSGFSVYTFSFSERTIITVANYLKIYDIHKLLSRIKDSVQRVISSDLDSFRIEMGYLITRLKGAEENQLTTSDNLFSLDILCSILKLLQLGKPERRRPSINNRFKAIKKVEEFINDSEKDINITIPELIEISEVSERTLCYAFQDYYGISPKAYLKNYRLNQLHKALYSASRNTNAVAKIAKQFGFWHMGKLAKDYQQLFNEKPLETLKK